MKTVPNRKLRNGGYDAIHKWLFNHFGKADVCENEDCPGGEIVFHWALIKGKAYEHKRENFMMLGGKCHRNYDMTSEMRKVLRHSKDSYKKPIGQFNKNNILIKKWEGLNDVIRGTGFNKGNVTSCLLGYRYRKTAHGFIWRYL